MHSYRKFLREMNNEDTAMWFKIQDQWVYRLIRKKVGDWPVLYYGSSIILAKDSNCNYYILKNRGSGKKGHITEQYFSWLLLGGKISDNEIIPFES